MSSFSQMPQKNPRASWNWIDLQMAANPAPYSGGSFGRKWDNTPSGLAQYRTDEYKVSPSTPQDKPWGAAAMGQSSSPTTNDSAPIPPVQMGGNGDYSFIRSQEGFSPTAYYDVNGYAIGYGTHTWKGQPVQKGQSITQQEADSAWQDTVKPYADTARRLLPNVSPQQHEAFTSFIYNHGVNSARAQHLAELINSNNPSAKAYWEYSKNPKLADRRRAEAAMFFGRN